MSDWTARSPRKCYQTKPDNLFKAVQNAHDSMTQSTHDWCQSCYSLYNKLCQQVAAAFTPSLKLNDKQEFNVADFTSAVASMIDGSEDMLDKYIVERGGMILQALINCISSRRFQHQNCYEHRLLYKDRGILRGDVDHESFVISLAEGFDKIRSLYNSTLANLNKKRQLKKQQPISSVLDSAANKNIITVINHYVKNTVDDVPQKTKRKSKIRHKYLTSYKNSRTKQRRAKRSSQRKSQYRATLPPYETIKQYLDDEA